MRIHAGEGLAPGKFVKSRTFDACLPSRFNLLRQNAGLRMAIMCPVTWVDRLLIPKKVNGIILKNFGQTSFTIQKLSGGENK
jgi:hypothetical protein